MKRDRYFILSIIITFLLSQFCTLGFEDETKDNKNTVKCISISKIREYSPRLNNPPIDENTEEPFYTEYNSQLVDRFETYLDSIIALQDRYQRFVNSKSDHLLNLEVFEQRVTNFSNSLIIHSSKVNEHNARHAGKESVPILDYYECNKNNRLFRERNNLIDKEDSLVKNGIRLLTVRNNLDSLSSRLIEENKKIDRHITERIYEDIQEEGGNAVAGFGQESKEKGYEFRRLESLRDINSEYYRIFVTKNELRDSILKRRKKIDKYESTRQELLERIEQNNNDFKKLETAYYHFRKKKSLSREKYQVERLILLAKIIKLRNRAWIVYERSREFASICRDMEIEEEEFIRQYNDLAEKTISLDKKKEELLLNIK